MILKDKKNNRLTKLLVVISSITSLAIASPTTVYAYFGDKEIIQRDLSFDEAISSEIQDAFLYTKQEVKSINKSQNIEYGDFNSDDDVENKFNFKISKPQYKVDLDKETQERIAYNAYNNNHYEIALKIYKRLVKEHPFDNYPRYCLALTYNKLKQFQAAKRIYFDLLNRKPKNKEEVVANLISILSKDSPKEAIYLLNKLTNQNPKSGYFLAQKALILQEIGNDKMAIRDMMQATLIEPDRIDYRFNLAVIYDRNEKFEEALETYSAVVRDYQSNQNPEYNIPINEVISRIDIVKTFI